LDRLSVITDSMNSSQAVGRELESAFVIRALDRRGVLRAEPSKYSVCDIDLDNNTHLSELRQWLARRPRSGKVVFAVSPGVRQQVVQAYALGATDVVERPMARGALLNVLFGDITGLAGTGTELVPGSKGIAAGIKALQGVFAAAMEGSPVDLRAVNTAGNTVVSNIEEDGIARWIDSVRQHHSQTYQHCLLVTGVAVAFGEYLGFSAHDRQKLALAGLLHDIGKAVIPLGILEKPGPLTKEEFDIMKQHPVLGFEALREVEGLHADMLDVVVHHHEYLDGSGYPHGLEASQLSDLVRLATIADVFGALIERRSYKPPMSGEGAYQIIEDMGPKLDRDLVRAFRPFARARVR
jgi:putative nucleotidyltransferase with HDIG domain